MLGRLPDLQSLSLSGAWMWGGDQALASSLAGLSKLTQLNLTGFYRPCFFWEAFGEHVTALQRLKSVAVQDNALMPHEGQSLLRGLAALPQLLCLKGDVEPLGNLHADLERMAALSRLELFVGDCDQGAALQLDLSKSLGNLGEKVQVVVI